MTNSKRRDTLDRRTVLKLAAVGAAVPALAGCSGGGDAGGSDLESWLADARNHDGIVDETGSAEVTVAVGAENGFAFGPAAIRVDAGTAVVWEWTGDGGYHNVVAEDGSFESETVGEAGHTFERVFEETGTYRYVCVPHEHRGMKGAVVVE